MTRQTEETSIGFDFFTEIGIISQLSSALFAKVLPDGLHVAHFSILNHMARLGDGKTPQSLASALQVNKATMTHSLGVLSGRGFIRIEAHPTDGRSKIVFLTDTGRAFREEAISAVMSAFAHLLRDEDLERMNDLLPGLRALRKHLDENRDVRKAEPAGI